MDKAMAGPLAHSEIPLVTLEQWQCDVDAFFI